MRSSKNQLLFGIVLLLGALIPSKGQAQGTNIIVTTVNDVINPGDGLCSLREAVISANTDPGIIPPGECAGGSAAETDVIVLAEDTAYYLSIPGTGEDAAATGDLDVLNNPAEVDIRIIVDADDASVIDAESLDRVFHLHGASLEVVNLYLQDGDVSNNGGIILNEGGSLYLDDCNVSLGMATSGGGIFNDDGRVTLAGSVLTINASSLNGGALMSVGPNAAVLIDSSVLSLNESTGSSGGAISANEGTVVIRDGSGLSDNAANANGGAINLTGTAVLTVTESTLIDNTATLGHGGAVFSSASDPAYTIQVTDSTFTDNDAAGAGGAIASLNMGVESLSTSFYGNIADTDGGAISGGGVWVYGGIFSGNFALGGGGAIKGSIVVLEDADFNNNASGANGGAVHLADGQVTRGSFIENQADIGFGGAIFQAGSGRLDAFNVQFRGNSALSGGGIYAYRAFVHDSSFIGNSGPVSGGAIYGEGLVQATGSTFLQNSAGFNGGAVYQDGNLASADHYIHSSTFAFNSAGNDGGAIWAGSQQGLTIANSTISTNEADLGGGLFVDGNVEVALINVTLANNTASSFGGGFYMVGDVLVQNTIIAGNAPQNCISAAVNVTTLGNNIASDGTCDLNLGSDLENTDPQLGILTDNGGPTLTHALLTGSPAIDSANAAACAAAHVNGVDQRGVWRPVGPGCDIGAFEFGQMLFLPIVIRD